jgi:hypothetical protein
MPSAIDRSCAAYTAGGDVQGVALQREDWRVVVRAGS